MTNKERPQEDSALPGALSDGQLERELLAAVVDHQSSKRRLLHLLAAYDDRGGWARWGATSCAVWWADAAGIELSTAREQLRVAKALQRLPAFDKAMADGRLSYAKIKVLSRLADQDTVDELILIGEECAAGRLGVALAAWRSQKESAAAIAEAQHAARSLSFRTDPDGMVTASLRLPPVAGGAVQALVDVQMMHIGGTTGSSIGQLRADAMEQILNSGAGLHGANSSVSAEVVVHVHQAESGDLVATLPDGTPVPEPQLSEVLCGSTIRALVHDSDGQPVDASPARRAPTKRQLRLLWARDKRCQEVGCRATSFLHAHHIQHREHGGPTTLANLELLCSFHHRARHQRDIEERLGYGRAA